MTKREEYDKLAAELKAAWQEATADAKEGEEELRQLRDKIEAEQ